MSQQIAQMEQEKAAKIAEINAKGEVDARLKQMDHAHELDKLAKEGKIDAKLIVVKGEVQSVLDEQKGHHDVFRSQMHHELGAARAAALPID
jgi:hypothetical protein